MPRKVILHKFILLICAIAMGGNVWADENFFSDMGYTTPTGLNKVYFVPKDKIEQHYDYVQAIVEKQSVLTDGAMIRIRYMLKNDTEGQQLRIALDCSPSARRQFAKLEPENDKKTGKCNVSIKLHDGSKLDFNNVVYIYIKSGENGCAIAPVIEINDNTMPKLLKIKESDMKSIALYKNGSLVGQEISVNAHNSTTLDDMLDGYSKRVKVDQRLMHKSNFITEAALIKKYREMPRLMDFAHPTSQHVVSKSIQWAQDSWIEDVCCTMYYTKSAATNDANAVTDIYFVPENYVPIVRDGKEITSPPRVENFILHIDGDDQFFGAWVSTTAMKEDGTLCKVQMELKLNEVFGDRIFFLLTDDTMYHPGHLQKNLERSTTSILKSPVITSQ